MVAIYANLHGSARSSFGDIMGNESSTDIPHLIHLFHDLQLAMAHDDHPS